MISRSSTTSRAMHPKLKFHLAVTTHSTLPCVHSHLHHAIGIAPTRLASTSTSSTSPKFPFPTYRNPTPHQIFHLSPGASQAEIKARCKSSFPPSFQRPTQSLNSCARLRTCADFSSRLAHRSCPPCEPAPRALSRHYYGL